MLYALDQYPGNLTAPFSLSSTQHSASPSEYCAERK